jgi:hypothetical protein
MGRRGPSHGLADSYNHSKREPRLPTLWILDSLMPDLVARSPKSSVANCTDAHRRLRRATVVAYEGLPAAGEAPPRHRAGALLAGPMCVDHGSGVTKSIDHEP